jgi:hypothetical protein
MRGCCRLSVPTMCTTKCPSICCTKQISASSLPLHTCASAHRSKQRCPWQNRAVTGAAERPRRAPRVAHARHRKVCTLATMALAALMPDGADRRVAVHCSYFERISKYSSSAGSADNCRPRSRALPASLPYLRATPAQCSLSPCRPVATTSLG